MRQIVLDTETTGLETSAGHRIIEIGAVELINRRITGKHFHRYINPQRAIDAGAANVHGITQEFLADKPVFADIVTEFLDFVKYAELIIHNATFDVGFLNHELQLIDHANQQAMRKITDFCQVTDTLTLARQRHPGQKNNLDALCKRYSIDNSHREWHGALLDAELLARVYLVMTGGQGTLFDETQLSTKTVASVQAEISLEQRAPLRIVYATPEELALHQQQLNELSKKSENGCIWLALEKS